MSWFTALGRGFRLCLRCRHDLDEFFVHGLKGCELVGLLCRVCRVWQGVEHGLLVLFGDFEAAVQRLAHLGALHDSNAVEHDLKVTCRFRHGGVLAENYLHHGLPFICSLRP